MKQSYTNMALWMSPMIKSGMTWEEIGSAFMEYPRNMGIEDYVAAMSIGMERCVYEGSAGHLFLPGIEFCNWIVSCVSELDPLHASVIQQMIGIDTVGVLHFPTSAKKCSVAFLIPKSGRDIWGFDIDYGGIYMTASRDNQQELANCGVLLSKQGGCSDGFMWYAKLIVGLGMYCDCFPEVIKPGPPEDIKHPSFHKYPKVSTIGISNKVCQAGTHDSPFPHFRRGHFRVLKSDRFTHKRFQTVFVKQTFVRGRSETILSPEQV